jgi:hypothetical protein
MCPEKIQTCMFLSDVNFFSFFTSWMRSYSSLTMKNQHQQPCLLRRQRPQLLGSAKTKPSLPLSFWFLIFNYQACSFIRTFVLLLNVVFLFIFYFITTYYWCLSFFGSMGRLLMLHSFASVVNYLCLSLSTACFATSFLSGS